MPPIATKGVLVNFFIEFKILVDALYFAFFVLDGKKDPKAK